MTRNALSNRRRAISTARVVALWVAGVLGCFSMQGHAEDDAVTPRSVALVDTRDIPAGIEKAFWACDYAATTRLVGAEEGAHCSVVYEDLKKKKFDGDFQTMLDWWRKNKLAEHQALARSKRELDRP